MATKNTKAAKPSHNSKTASAAKKAIPAKPTVASSKKTAKAAGPAKKTAAPEKKSPVKKAAPTKSASPEKPQAKKSATAGKSTPDKKPATNTNQQTVNKKNSKAATPAKKSTPVKKTAPSKKAAPVAKKAAPAKHEAKAVAKPAAKAVARPVAKAPVKPAAKAPEKPVVKNTAAKTEISASQEAARKKVIVAQTLLKANPAAPRPMATPVARPVEKKPNVVIAHRRLENKSKEQKEVTPTQYQPETYRSILDEAPVPQGPVYRYSDEELAEFREIITSRLDAARKELNYLQGLITRKDEAGTEDTENRYMNMEDGSGAMEREQLAQLASRQIQFMSHLEKALVRIENKTYGICRVTGKLIDKARLRAVPHATLSIEAKKMMASK